MDSKIAKKLIVIGSDHAGFKLKQHLKKYIEGIEGFELLDLGTNTFESCDFPDYAERVCLEVLKNEDNRGIIICGSGIGVSIAANKVPGIRCALVHDHLTTRLAKEHTNCNVIAMGERIIGTSQAETIVDAFITSEFIRAPNYLRRLDKITELEKKHGNKSIQKESSNEEDSSSQNINNKI
jgi:ribose 5-phosphate isomerase B